MQTGGAGTGAGMVPPPMNQQYQQQPQFNYHHQQQQQQQWMMPPPQQQQQQQPYQPQQAWAQQQPPAQQQYPSGGSEEIKSLWIGDLQPWMDEKYLYSCFANTGQVQAGTVKVIRNKLTAQPEGYGFIEFSTRAAAEMVLQTYNGTPMPNSEQTFRMNWASLGAGEKRMDNTPEYSLFVGDLGPEVSDYVLQDTFKPHYPSVKGAKVVMDRQTNRSKGYGFVKFGDETEHLRAMSEMNGVLCSTRPMRIGPAANKKPAVQQYQKASYPSAEANPGETDPNNTTIFVGGLDDSVTDDYLRQVFGQFGELIHVKIPPGKRCGFVQFADRACAEQAQSALNGSQLGGHTIRLSWGRSSGNKQAQPDQTQSSGPYYGNGQGYPQAYGYAPPAQNPNMYYGGYPAAYGNYQQPQQ